MKPTLWFLILGWVALCVQWCIIEPTDDLPLRPFPDTTSHGFHWTFDTLGIGGTYLYDVALAEANDIWVVGELTLPDPDSSWNNTGYETFNAAHWNGDVWDYIHVPAVTHWGSTTRASIDAIHQFGASDVWLFAHAGSYAHWDGTTWTSEWVEEHNGTIYAAWGTSASNLYSVGGNGTITHYDGSQWHPLSTGTTLDVYDIWGAPDPRTGEYTVLAVASNLFASERSQLLQIDSLTVTPVEARGLPVSLKTLWFDPGLTYYLGGMGVYHTPKIDSVWTPFALPRKYVNGMDGNHAYDVMIAGSGRLLMHYNGNNWVQYLPISTGVFATVKIHGDVAVAVGFLGNQGLVATGVR